MANPIETSKTRKKVSPAQRFFQKNMTQVVTFGVLILLCLAVSTMSTTFLTVSNMINVVLQATVIGIIAIGMSFVIFSDGIDLSVGSVMALSCTIMGDLCVNKGMNGYLAMFCALAIGALAGALNGVLITKANMPQFIVTMGTMYMWRGVALEWVDGQGMYGLPDGLKALGSAYVGIIPYAVILLFTLYVVAWFIIRKTEFGMHTYAIGDNERAAKLSGIKVHRMRIIIYTISGLMCGIAAIVVAGRMNGSTPTVGQSYELEAIAGVAIGGASMGGGSGSIWGTLIGVIMVQVIRNAMNMLALSTYYQQIIIGIIIIGSVAIDCLRRKKAD